VTIIPTQARAERTITPPGPRPVTDLRQAATIIRQVAGNVDPALRVALEAEAARLESTVRNVRDAERVREGNGA